MCYRSRYMMGIWYGCLMGIAGRAVGAPGLMGLLASPHSAAVLARVKGRPGRPLRGSALDPPCAGWAWRVTQSSRPLLSS